MAWSQVYDGSSAVGVVVIDPHNGPGISTDPVLASEVSQAQQLGIKVMGYVYTRYASGPVTLQAAEGQVSSYLAWYHVNGVLFDQLNSSCVLQTSEYYHSLYAYVKSISPQLTVMLNPGTSPQQCYAKSSDIIMDFEGNQTQYVNYQPLPWTRSYPSGMFCNLILGVPDSASMNAFIAAAIGKNVGWIYITNYDVTSGSPYGSVPDYFKQEVASVDGLDGVPDTWHDPQGPTAIVLVLGVVLAVVAVALVLDRGSSKIRKMGTKGRANVPPPGPAASHAGVLRSREGRRSRDP